jgi:hypothetical protein
VHSVLRSGVWRGESANLQWTSWHLASFCMSEWLVLHFVYSIAGIYAVGHYWRYSLTVLVATGHSYNQISKGFEINEQMMFCGDIVALVVGRHNSSKFQT